MIGLFTLLSQLCVITAFYYTWLLSKKILKNKILSLISIMLLEGIFFYNFTTPEFNVNVCQLPFGQQPRIMHGLVIQKVK